MSRESGAGEYPRTPILATLSSREGEEFSEKLILCALFFLPWSNVAGIVQRVFPLGYSRNIFSFSLLRASVSPWLVFLSVWDASDLLFILNGSRIGHRLRVGVRQQIARIGRSALRCARERPGIFFARVPLMPSRLWEWRRPLVQCLP